MTMSDEQNNGTRVIQAAGGLLWRSSPRGKEIAVIHRPRYSDWTLPKGWLDNGESWQEAALREVKEETCCDARLGDFAGCCCYEVKHVPKIVLFWHMNLIQEHPFRSNEETDELVWLTVDEALAKLSYPGERALLKNQ